MKKPIILIFVILLIDQLLKFWIKTNMYLGQEYLIAGDWFIIHFTENNGMAFGFEFAGEWGKLFLTGFRIIAIGGIGWYLYDLVRKGEPKGFIYCIALVMAGAIGNTIDSVFYGAWFTHSHYQLATFNPIESYGTFFQGKVVDMFYFPVLTGHYPQWFPMWAGEEFIFFRPVFNIADASISIGIIVIIIMQKQFFAHHDSQPVMNQDPTTEPVSEN